MDRSSSAGHVHPESLSASEKSVIANSVQAASSKDRSQPLRSNPMGPINYQVADLFGRCFLKICYWVEVVSSLTRRGESVHYTALRKPANHAPQHPANASGSAFDSEQAVSTLSGSSDVGNA